MAIQVKKRDGKTAEYDEYKIVSAVSKAVKDVYRSNQRNVSSDMGYDVAVNITQHLQNEEIGEIHVETIQDMVEEQLMERDKAVARAYILYRADRNKLRNSKTYQVFNGIINTEVNDITKENANMNAETPAGMMMKFASETTKAYADDCLISAEAREAVDNNYIHIHDKDYYPTKSLTCLQHPLNRILENGFRAGHGASRPAKRIETASIIGCISMETVQNEMHGGQAIPAFDFYLAPYVRYTYIEEIKKLEDYDNADYSSYYDYDIKDYVNDDTIKYYPKPVKKAIIETLKRVHQSMEAFIHNMNTIHSRGGNQVVFSSINYGTDTSAEGRCIIRELLLSTYKGVGNGETPIFPIQIWKLKKGVSAIEGDKNYDLLKFACKVTAKRFFPNFLNLDADFNKHDKWNINDPKRYEYEVATMGCVRGKSSIRWSDKSNSHYNDFFDKSTSIEEFWNYAAEKFGVKTYGLSEYIDLFGVFVSDTSSFHGMVNCKKLIKNPNMGNWLKIKLENGFEIECTSDHPFPKFIGGNISIKKGTIHFHKSKNIFEKSFERTYALSLEIGDLIPIANSLSSYIENFILSPIVSIEKIDINECSYDVETSSDRFDVNGIISNNCRTRVFENRHGEKTPIGRGNCSFTTINLVKIALECRDIEDFNERIKKFYSGIDKYVDISVKQLKDRYEFQKTAFKSQFPMLMSGLWNGSEKLNKNDRVNDVLLQGTLGVGFIGLAECLIALTGKHHGESQESQNLGLEIISHLKQRVDEWANKLNLNYSVLATPAEGLSGKFTKKDRNTFGVIRNITDKDYYTNSNHVPVWYHCSIKHKAKIEAPYHALTLGGHILYVEFDGDATHNSEAVLQFTRIIRENNAGYGSVNHLRNRCLSCGYENAQKDMKICPKCGSEKIDTIQRITGYLVGTTDSWNDAKKAELNDRVCHD